MRISQRSKSAEFLQSSCGHRQIPTYRARAVQRQVAAQHAVPPTGCSAPAAPYRSATPPPLRENTAPIASSKWQKSQHWEGNQERRGSRGGILLEEQHPAGRLSAASDSSRIPQGRAAPQATAHVDWGQNRPHRPGERRQQIQWWQETWTQKMRIILYACSSYGTQVLSLLNHNFSVIYIVSLSFLFK